ICASSPVTAVFRGGTAGPSQDDGREQGGGDDDGEHDGGDRRDAQMVTTPVGSRVQPVVTQQPELAIGQQRTARRGLVAYEHGAVPSARDVELDRALGNGAPR